MKILCSYRGGSYSYGLNTPTSDVDERYLFLHTDIPKIIGLEKQEHVSLQNDDVDSFGWELRHFLGLLKKGNTMCLEIMFNKDWISVDPEFLTVQEKRNNLIDSHQLFKCLRGYCQSERRLVLGEKTGVLGGKRRGHLDTYGYSYKNATQFLRLCKAGDVFFQTGEFPVNIRPFDNDGLIYTVKTQPEKFTKDGIIKIMDDYEAKLVTSYETIKVIRKYDETIANDICFKLYARQLVELKPSFFAAQ